MNIVERLTENIVARDLRQEGAALVSKWEKTGLLEGLGDDRTRDNMSRLLENQAKELLREASTMATGDVEGFAAVAFPIVRRVFGGLIANDLVSVQPMSLPSGLIFFLDFTVSDETGSRLGMLSGDSLYGGGRVGAEITGGVSLSGLNSENSFYALNNGYSSPTSSLSVTCTNLLSGTYGDGDDVLDRLVRYDPDFVSGTTTVAIGSLAVSDLTQLNLDNLVAISCSTALAGAQQVRRLSQFSGTADTDILVVFASLDGTATPVQLSSSFMLSGQNYVIPIDDDFVAGQGLGSVVGDPQWGLEAQTAIPEIDIKVDSVSITAITKKLKAKWTPELGQDLNAYHNLDAEVELTSILSEQIALEIDREILEDLVKGATAGKYYWSRAAGRFVNRLTGQEIGAATATPDFTGTVSEWYETLVETINDVSAQIHRKTLRGGANFLVCGPEVANVLEFTAGFRANITADADMGTVGAVKVGALSKKWDVYVDPYFPRNVILVGRKGGSFLESGYVYAPYVPLQVTPTIFGTEDFVPRKGVMTRYGKKMVRPDMYGLVIVVDLV